MEYHFKVHKEKKGYWAECLELSGCQTQANHYSELLENMEEALNLFLDEPPDSKTIFPLPRVRLFPKKSIVSIPVNPQIAFSFLLRRERLKRKLTQAELAKKMGVPLFSYQRLENSKTANPEWKTLIKISKIFSHFPIQKALSI